MIRIFITKTKRDDILFQKYWIISSACSLLASKIFAVGKYCNYSLITTQDDCFASCESIVSRSKTSSLPPGFEIPFASEFRRTALLCCRLAASWLLVGNKCSQGEYRRLGYFVWEKFVSRFQISNTSTYRLGRLGCQRSLASALSWRVEKNP